MKKHFIRDITPGDKVDDLFVLMDKALSTTRKGKSFLNLSLSDRSGKAPAKVWDNAEQLSSAAKVGEVVRVKGEAGEYRGEVQITVREMSPVPPDEVSPADFIPATGKDVDDLMARLIRLVESVKNDHVRALLESFLKEPDFARRFAASPAAKSMHHAYAGGLLEHVLSMAILADKLAHHYEGVDRDLLIAGAVLHDIGKVEELGVSTGIDYTDEGRLLGHIVMGLCMVERRIADIDGFDPKTAMLLKHMMASHHGAQEFGSPQPPKTLEAVLLNYIDEIDARINGIRSFMDQQDPDEPWTPFHRLLMRQFYKP